MDLMDLASFYMKFALLLLGYLVLPFLVYIATVIILKRKQKKAQSAETLV